MPEEKKQVEKMCWHMLTQHRHIFFTGNTCEFTQRLHVFNILESETPQQPNSFHQQLPARMKHWVQKLTWQHIKSLAAIEIGPFWGPRPLIEWMAYHLVTWGSAEGISCRTKRISFSEQLSRPYSRWQHIQKACGFLSIFWPWTELPNTECK